MDIVLAHKIGVSEVHKALHASHLNRKQVILKSFMFMCSLINDVNYIGKVAASGECVHITCKLLGVREALQVSSNGNLMVRKPLFC